MLEPVAVEQTPDDLVVLGLPKSGLFQICDVDGMVQAYYYVDAEASQAYLIPVYRKLEATAFALTLTQAYSYADVLFAQYGKPVILISILKLPGVLGYLPHGNMFLGGKGALLVEKIKKGIISKHLRFINFDNFTKGLITVAAKMLRGAVSVNHFDLWEEAVAEAE
jgi:hypothetical protein